MTFRRTDIWKSYSRRSFLQEYDIRVQFGEASLQLGHRQVGCDDEETFALIVFAAVEFGEGQAFEVEAQQLIHQIRPIHSSAGVAAENNIDRRVGVAAALLDFDGQVSDFHCLAHTNGVEECQVVAVNAECAVAFLAHNAVILANHEHRDAVLGKAGVEGADNFARVGGVGDDLVEVLWVVFFAGIHIALCIIPTYLIRRAPNNIFWR